ncbi:MAG: class I adenylate-forming enzyme family protein [Anaerolineales bacterium]|jgi:acyl-CoA synthetase (AMP-forming)/AMP-acid ligase II
MSKQNKITRQMTLGEGLHCAASNFGRRIALVEDEGRITYRQLCASVDRLAEYYHSIGVGKGDRVALLLWSGTDFIISFFAAVKIGAVAAPLPPRLQLKQMLSYLCQLEPTIVVASTEIEIPEGLEALTELMKEMPCLKEILITDQQEKNGRSFAEIIAVDMEPAECDEPLAPKDLATILYTSGTTGESKGVMHSHRGLISPVVASIKLREMWMSFFPTLGRLKRWVRVLIRYGARLVRAAGRQQVFLSTMSMHTISGLEAMLQALLMGDRLVVQPRFNPVQSLKLIEKERVSILIGVPLSYMTMLRVQDFERFKLSSLLICATGAAPCPPELAREIQQKFGCAVHVGFGMTELGGGIAATMLEDSPILQAETVGKAMPGMDIMIVDEQKQPLPRGEIGVLACRTDSMMLGYYGNQERDIETPKEDGFFYTGDLAVMDENGYIRIVGRKKDMIIRGGQNIHPARIENVLIEMPEINDAAIVGIPDAMGIERVWAFIIFERGRSLEKSKIMAQCRECLEVYEVPEKVQIVENFPRTSTGKAQKFKLRQIALEKVGTYER